MSGFWKRWIRSRSERPASEKPAPPGERTRRGSPREEESALETPPIEGVATSVAAFIGRARAGPVNRPSLIHGFGEFDTIFGGLWKDSRLGFAVRHFFLNGGRDAIVVRINEREDSQVDESDLVGSPEARSGMHALEDAAIFNLLCLPPLRPGIDITPQTFAAAANYCASRRAFLLIDAPSHADDPRSISAFAGTLPSMARENAALFFPRMLASNPLEGHRDETLVPSGAVAGVFARTDESRGVWKAPAGRGATLSDVSGLAYDISDAENEGLNRLAINCLRGLPGVGVAIWGARTLEGASGQSGQWQFIPVRRLALYIESSIHRGTGWAVFEPNDEILWSRLRQSVVNFMDQLFRAGALQGSKPDEAYFVRCDRGTMTRDDIEEGVVNLQVGFAPLKPAEFVVLRIQQKTSGPRR